MYGLGTILSGWLRLVVQAAAAGAPTPATAPAPDVHALLERMEAGDRGSAPGDLAAAGSPGLAALLARVAPQPDASVPKGTELVAQLGSDDGRVREAAAGALARAPGRYRADVVRAAESESPEVRARAKRLLAEWSAAAATRPAANFSRAAREYATKLDPATAAAPIAQHLSRSLADGLPPSEYRDVVAELLTMIVRSKDEQLLEPFVPLLKHADVQVAVFVTSALGRPVHGNGYYPPFLLNALESDRDEVIRAAVASGPAPIWDRQRFRRIHALMKRAFVRGPDALKFDLSFTLMQSFRDPDAFAYLVGQVRSDDRKRALSAISWVGDSCHWRRPVPPELVEALRPLLSSRDDAFRRSAANALGTWSGEPVVDLLIPMLDDPVEIIRKEVSGCLADQADQVMLRAKLSAAAASHPSAEVRAASRRVLDRLKAD